MGEKRKRILLRIPKENSKLIRWLELGRQMPRGYYSSVISTEVICMFLTGDVVSLGTVNPENATAKEEQSITVFLTLDSDPYLATKLPLLISAIQAQYILELLDMAVCEGRKEQLLSVGKVAVAAVQRNALARDVSAPGEKTHEVRGKKMPTHTKKTEIEAADAKEPEPERERAAEDAGADKQTAKNVEPSDRDLTRGMLAALMSGDKKNK